MLAHLVLELESKMIGEAGSEMKMVYLNAVPRDDPAGILRSILDCQALSKGNPIWVNPPIPASPVHSGRPPQ